MNINWMVDLWLAHLHLVHLPIENQHKSTIDGPWLQPAGFPSFDHLKTPNISKNHPQFLGLYSSSIHHQQLIYVFFQMSCAFTIFTRKHDFVLIFDTIHHRIGWWDNFNRKANPLTSFSHHFPIIFQPFHPISCWFKGTALPQSQFCSSTKGQLCSSGSLLVHPAHCHGRRMWSLDVCSNLSHYSF